MSENACHDVNFFRPKSPHALADMKTILTLFVIWVVAVFGFQVALIVLNQDTPEEAYVNYQAVASQVQSGAASEAEKQTFARSLLSVLGKNIALSAEHRSVLQQSLSLVVSDLLAEADRPTFSAAIQAGGDSTPAVALAKDAIGLGTDGFDPVMVDLLSSSLVPAASAGFDQALPEIMKKYLVHNQSVLTDFKFIGFPFHYWYTAQFLLVMFVVMCLVYAVAIDSINKKHDFEEK